MAVIAIGLPATDRASTFIGDKTLIAVDNPANDTGTITKNELFAVSGKDLADCKVGTFYGSGTDYTSREWENIGAVTGGSKQTFSGLDCDVTLGDFIGIYWSNEFTGNIERDLSGFSGVYSKVGDQFGAGLQTYTIYSGNGMSVYGEGATGGAAGLENKSANMGAKMIAGKLI